MEGKAALEMLLSLLKVYVLSGEQWHCFNNHTPMNCCHAHLSELRYFRSVTKDEPPGKLYFSLLLLNLKPKADKGAVNPPDGCPVRKVPLQQRLQSRVGCNLSPLSHSPERAFLCWQTFVAEEMEAEGRCACAGSTDPSAVREWKLQDPLRDPCACTMQVLYLFPMPLYPPTSTLN